MQSDPLKQYLALRQQLAAEKVKLQARLAEIDQALGGEVPAASSSVPAVIPPAPPASGKRDARNVTSEGRKRLSMLAKARWARARALGAATLKGTGKKAAPAPAAKAAAKPVTKPKPPLSPEGKARIIAAQKARWAKIKALKAK